MQEGDALPRTHNNIVCRQQSRQMYSQTWPALGKLARIAKR